MEEHRQTRFAQISHKELLFHALCFLLCCSCMAETEQCGIETRKDGTKICSLHKQPLQETTVLEQVPEGKPYPKTRKRSSSFQNFDDPEAAPFTCARAGQFLFLLL